MRRLLPPHDLFWVTLAAVLATGLALSDVDVGALRPIVGLLSTLVLPGYALAAAVFPPGRLGSVERMTLTLGLSLVVGALGVFLLVITGIRFTADAWAAIVALQTGGATLVAALRSEAISPWRQHATLRIDRGTLGTAASLLLACAIAVTSIALATRHAAKDRGAGFTQLSLVAASSTSAVVTVTSHERGATNFRLSVTPSLASEGSLQVRVLPGQSWRRLIRLPEHRHQAVQARLYRAGDPGTYRWASLASTS